MQRPSPRLYRYQFQTLDGWTRDFYENRRYLTDGWPHRIVVGPYMMTLIRSRQEGDSTTASKDPIMSGVIGDLMSIPITVEELAGGWRVENRDGSIRAEGGRL